MLNELSVFESLEFYFIYSFFWAGGGGGGGWGGVCVGGGGRGGNKPSIYFSLAVTSENSPAVSGELSLVTAGCQ